MAGKNQHVVKRDDGWAVRSEVLIHGENGRIRERNSYGNDPHPPKG